MKRGRPSHLRTLWRGFALVLLCGVSLQLYFVLRVVSMILIDPQSTTFQRSEAWRLLSEKHQIVWSQQWVDDARISDQLKRAVIASEDANFGEHFGVEWEAIESAWQKNQRAEARADRINEQAGKLIERQIARRAASKPGGAAPERPRVQAKVIGGSTITQQLAKNLFLCGERTVLRKGQEFAITLMLESMLSKRRILEIYLNNVEWGEGLFGAQAAARNYFRVDASQLGAYPAARLAVMLPAPKRFEKRPGSPYVSGRASTIVARMGGVAVP